MTDAIDAALERRIQSAYGRYKSDPVAAWPELRRLILKRSPVQIVRMERAKGLIQPERTIGYSEKLLDPRWQRKRLEVLQRSDFTCEHCGAADKTLHVHHKAYKRGRQPWEYGDRELLALCENCHKSEHS